MKRLLDIFFLFCLILPFNERYLLLQSLIAVAMVLYGTIDSLIDFFSFTAWIFYGGAMFALIVMRYTKPHAPRPYKVSLELKNPVFYISLILKLLGHTSSS